MANICFTVLHYRTPFLYLLSKELEKRGHIISWLCPSPKWFKWLVKQGVDATKILDQTQAVREKSLNKIELANICEISKTENVSGLTLNSMILMDRLLVKWDAEEATNYLVRLYPLVRNFLIQNNIDVVIGEATPANELLTSVICEHMEIPYYFPMTVRIPYGRFAFFRGRFHTELVSPRGLSSNTDTAYATVWAEQFIEEFKNKQPKPAYWYKNNVRPSVKLNWGKKLLKNFFEEIRYKKSDPTRFPISWLLAKRTSEVINRYAMKTIKFHEPKHHWDKPFVLYPLHKQPESSVDVLGDFYSDQLNLIKQIVRSLPISHKLFVKEHSNSIGDRPIWFYRELSRLPNLVLLTPYSDSFELIRRTSAIVTISGTMAFEAGLLGVPAITFSNMFFRELPSVRYCREIRDLHKLLLHCFSYSETEDDKNKKISFMSKLYLSSFEGIFTDCHAFPEVNEYSNICKVAFAVESIVEKQELYNIKNASIN